MAEEIKKSYAITQRDAGKVVNASKVKGTLFEAVGASANGASASVGSVYRMAQVPSNARVAQLLLYTNGQAAGATGDLDVGLYETTENGGAAVDVDFFAEDVDVNAANLAGADVTHKGDNSLDKSEKLLWEALGLTEDPHKDYDIALTVTEAVASAGTLALKVRYAI